MQHGEPREMGIQQWSVYSASMCKPEYRHYSGNWPSYTCFLLLVLVCAKRGSKVDIAGNRIIEGPPLCALYIKLIFPPINI